MKVYDCITYSNERLLFNLRLNILDKFVDRFIVIEANYSHSGNKKKLILISIIILNLKKGLLI